MSFFMFFIVLINFDVNVLVQSRNDKGQLGLNLPATTNIGITDTPADHDPIALPGLVVLPGSSNPELSSTSFTSPSTAVISSLTTTILSFDIISDGKTSNEVDIGLVVGIIVGAVLLAIGSVVIGVVFLRLRRKTRTKKKDTSQGTSYDTTLTNLSSSSKGTYATPSPRGTKHTKSRSRSRSKRASRRLSTFAKHSTQTTSTISRRSKVLDSPLYDQIMFKDSTKFGSESGNTLNMLKDNQGLDIDLSKHINSDKPYKQLEINSEEVSPSGRVNEYTEMKVVENQHKDYDFAPDIESSEYTEVKVDVKQGREYDFAPDL